MRVTEVTLIKMATVNSPLKTLQSIYDMKEFVLGCKDRLVDGKLKLPSSLENVQLPSSEKKNQFELPSLPNQVTLIITLPQNLKFCEKDTL